MRFVTAASVLAATAALAACGGGGTTAPVQPPTTNPAPVGSNAPVTSPSPTSSPTPTPAPSPAATVTANGTVTYAQDGTVNGTTGQFAQMLGDTAQGGQGQTVDGVTCQGTVEPTQNFYHVNAFLGLYVNGTMVALPAGIGEVQPVGPTQPGGTIYDHASQCMYFITKHDNSGTIHFENWNQPQPPPPIPAEYTLQNFFDIWGNGSSSPNWPFTGPVTVYAGSPTAVASNGNDLVQSYSLQSDAGSIPITKHLAIWLVVGPMPASGLPQVEFTMSQ